MKDEIKAKRLKKEIKNLYGKMSNKIVSGWESSHAIHPGEFLKDTLGDYTITKKELAKKTGMTPKTINEILKGGKAITREIALKLSKVFPISAEYWVNLQKRYEEDLKKTTN